MEIWITGLVVAVLAGLTLTVFALIRVGEALRQSEQQRGKDGGRRTESRYRQVDPDLLRTHQFRRLQRQHQLHQRYRRDLDLHHHRRRAGHAQHHQAAVLGQRWTSCGRGA